MKVVFKLDLRWSTLLHLFKELFLLPGITTTKTFFRSGDLDIASIDWGNGYHVYCVKTTYSKLNSVPVVPYYILKDQSS